MSFHRTSGLLKVPATKICPALTKVPNGPLNWFVPLPKVPNGVHPAPVMLSIRTMRLLDLSATKIAGIGVGLITPVQAEWPIPPPRRHTPPTKDRKSVVKGK